jgi:hypothetical protein
VALAAARRGSCPVLVAKLDRLSHEVSLHQWADERHPFDRDDGEATDATPLAADAVLHVENLVTPVEAKLATASRPARGAKWWRAS